MAQYINLEVCHRTQFLTTKNQILALGIFSIFFLNVNINECLMSLILIVQQLANLTCINQASFRIILSNT